MSTNGFPLKKLNKAFKRLLLKAFLFGSEKVSLKSVTSYCATLPLTFA